MKTLAGTGACFAAVGSITQAQKAQRALSAAAIQSAVTKSDTASSRRGCIYGVRFSCAQGNNVETVLSAAHITVKQWSTMP